MAVSREWIEIEDPKDGRPWHFDVTFLLSNWTCIYGKGCKGVLTEDATDMVQGCCSYGAHFSDSEDETNLLKFVERLTPEDWQFMSVGKKRGVIKSNRDGTKATRLVDDACIFLNRPDFKGGPGCALHFGALRNSETPATWKPEVCWQLPLHREDVTYDNGDISTFVSQWKRSDWGGGGEDFHWWCTESPEAFVGTKPTYKEMSKELELLCGTELAKALSSALDERISRKKYLKHPQVRKSAKKN
ncbi:MAG: hypothetical protein HKL80_04755 [Acidimicrobiales bacterium]|nr:hypothetical protein [Acidimicrobiales bacterium]